MTRPSEQALRDAREHALHPERVDREALVADLRTMIEEAWEMTRLAGATRDFGRKNVGRSRVDERERILHILAALPTTLEMPTAPIDTVAYVCRDAAISFIGQGACARCDAGELHDADPIDPGSGRYWHYTPSADPMGEHTPCPRPGDTADEMLHAAWRAEAERRKELDASIARARAEQAAL